MQNPILTPREREVLQILATGAPDKEIARRLDIATGTVGNHLQSIFVKLGVNNRTEAITVALRKGLCTLPRELER